MLLPRLITLLLGVPLLLWTAHLGGIPFLSLVVVLVLFALHEYSWILQRSGQKISRLLLLGGGFFMVLSLYLSGTAWGTPLKNQGTALGLSLLLALLVIAELIRMPPDRSLPAVLYAWFGLFWIAWSLGHLPLIRGLRPHGEAYLLFLFFSLWTLDIGAYLIGRLLGKRSLAPLISPKKSWEGAVGGALLCLAVAILLQRSFFSSIFTAREMIPITLFLILLGQFSDLSESWLKRIAGVKDASQILPGHGGILDRFDSFLLTTPLYYYWVSLK